MQKAINAENQSKKTEWLAFKLDRLWDRVDKYNSHRLFLTPCISENAIPNYLKIKRESTINNQDEHLAQQTLTVTVFFRLRKKKSKTKL